MRFAGDTHHIAHGRRTGEHHRGFTGEETDDAALTAMARNAPASTANQDKESSWNRVWAGLGRELLDPASGATADITGLTLSHAPTAGGWITICRRPAWSKGDKGPTYAPEMVGWIDRKSVVRERV